MERIGQVAVTAFALIFSDFNWRHFTPWNLWLLASFLLMVLYELYLSLIHILSYVLDLTALLEHQND